VPRSGSPAGIAGEERHRQRQREGGKREIASDSGAIQWDRTPYWEYADSLCSAVHHRWWQPKRKAAIAVVPSLDETICEVVGNRRADSFTIGLDAKRHRPGRTELFRPAGNNFVAYLFHPADPALIWRSSVRRIANRRSRLSEDGLIADPCP